MGSSNSGHLFLQRSAKIANFAKSFFVQRKTRNGLRRLLRGERRTMLRAGMLPVLFSGLPLAMTAQTSAALLSPAQGSKLSGSTATFTWSAGSEVWRYNLDINTAPGDPAATRVFSSGLTQATSATVTNLPTTGATLYATLGSAYDYEWHYVSYSFTEAGAVTDAETTLLSVNSSSVAFGDVGLNSPSSQSITLTSTGTSPVTVSAATVSGTGFKLSGSSLPVTLSTNQTTTLTVQFDPTAAGAATGTLTIANTSTNNASDVITLTGTGVTGTYEVNLSWDAPTASSVPVSGYNVYRSPSSGSSYEKVNSSTISDTTYVDSTVEAGETYDYIVESVDSKGNSSTPSNAISVNIP
jgi:hypothetical protein